MNGAGHRATGAAVAATSLHLAPIDARGAVAVLALTVVFSAGPGSPDVDNSVGWKRMDRFLPDEALCAGGPLGHRRLTHWWGIPALLWWVYATHPEAFAGLGPWTVRALITGWATHVAVDALLGEGGVPAAGWALRVGLHLNQDGTLATFARWASLTWTVYAIATLTPLAAALWPPALTP